MNPKPLPACACGREAIRGSAQNPVCAFCYAIEQKNAVSMIRYTKHLTNEDRKQYLEREAKDKWQAKIALAVSLVPPVPEGCEMMVDGFRRYYLPLNCDRP